MWNFHVTFDYSSNLLARFNGVVLTTQSLFSFFIEPTKVLQVHQREFCSNFHGIIAMPGDCLVQVAGSLCQILRSSFLIEVSNSKVQAQ